MIDVVVWVLNHSNATGNDRLALIVFAEVANADGTEAFPSLDTIAYRGRMTRGTASKCRKRLEASGRIARNGTDPYGKGVPNFTVRMDAEAEGPPPSLPDRNRWRGEGSNRKPHAEGTNEASRGFDRGAGEGTEIAPEPSLGTVLEPPVGENAPARVPKYRGKPVDVRAWRRSVAALAEFNRQTGKRFGALTGSGDMTESAKRIYGRLREHPELTDADVADVIRRTLASRWWGTNDPGIGVVFGPRVFEENLHREPVANRRLTGDDLDAVADELERQGR